MKRSLKTFTDTDGKKYRFNAVAFNRLFKDRQKQYKEDGKPEVLLRQDMSAKIGVSPDTIKSWRYMYKGPADLDLVLSIADFLSVEYSELLYEPEDENMNTSETVSMNQITNDTEVTSLSIAEENAAAEELFREMYESIEKFNAYIETAWLSSEPYCVENPTKKQKTEYNKELEKFNKSRDENISHAMDYYRKLKEDISIHAFKISMKAIKGSYCLLDKMYNQMFFSDSDEKNLEPVNTSSWGYAAFNGYHMEPDVSYYEELFDAFSEYPKR